MSWIQHFDCKKELLVLLRYNQVRNKEQCLVMSQFTFFGFLGWNIRLHFFFKEDETYYHNHPRNFLTLCLAGGYKEFLPDATMRIARFGTLSFIAARKAHRVQPLGKFNCTVVIAGPVIRKWKRLKATQKIILLGLPDRAIAEQTALLQKEFQLPTIKKFDRGLTDDAYGMDGIGNELSGLLTGQACCIITGESNSGAAFDHFEKTVSRMDQLYLRDLLFVVALRRNDHRLNSLVEMLKNYCQVLEIDDKQSADQIHLQVLHAMDRETA